jgi:hypothetical protein
LNKNGCHCLLGPEKQTEDVWFGKRSKCSKFDSDDFCYCSTVFLILFKVLTQLYKDELPVILSVRANFLPANSICSLMDMVSTPHYMAPEFVQIIYTFETEVKNI